MKSKTHILAFTLISAISFAQVGINNTNPKATLDVTAKNTDGSTAEGIIAPRLTGDQIKSADTKYTIDQKGTIIYATAAVGASTIKTANITAEGYYFFDGTVWQKLTGTSGSTATANNGLSVSGANVQLGGSALLADSSILTSGNKLTLNGSGTNGVLSIVGTGTGTSGDLEVNTAATTGNGVQISANSLTTGSGIRIITSNNTVNSTNGLLQVANTGTSITGILARLQSNSAAGSGVTVLNNGNTGIGTASPAASAILDVNVNSLASGSKKGFLGPQVALSSSTDVITIPSPASGLLVYNLGTGTLKYVGYVFWNGIEWRSLAGNSLVDGILGAITCNGVTLSPSTYSSGTAYSGTMNVPYTGGDGGYYAAQSVGPVNGLTATLQSGNFNNGSGTLSYKVTGTPTVTSPISTTFSLTIGGKTCSAVVGTGDTLAPGDLLYYKASMPSSASGVWLSAYVLDLPILGGKLRLDAYFNADSNGGNGFVSMFPRIVNTSSTAVKFWFSALTTVDSFNAGNYLLASSTPTGSGTSLAPSAYVELDNGIYYGVGYNDITGTTTPRTSGSGQGGHQEVLTLDLSLDNKWYRVYYFPTVDNKNTASTADNTREIFLSIQRLY